jgi:hypothetical protein
MKYEVQIYELSLSNGPHSRKSRTSCTQQHLRHHTGCENICRRREPVPDLPEPTLDIPIALHEELADLAVVPAHECTMLAGLAFGKVARFECVICGFVAVPDKGGLGVRGLEEFGAECGWQRGRGATEDGVHDEGGDEGLGHALPVDGIQSGDSIAEGGEVGGHVLSVGIVADVVKSSCGKDEVRHYDERLPEKQPLTSLAVGIEGSLGAIGFEMIKQVIDPSRYGYLLTERLGILADKVDGRGLLGPCGASRKHSD